MTRALNRAAAPSGAMSTATPSRRRPRATASATRCSSSATSTRMGKMVRAGCKPRVKPLRHLWRTDAGYGTLAPMSSDDPIRETRPEPSPRDALEEVLFEVKRVIVGQDAMLERLLVALLAGGHVLLEGVPGL